MVMVANKKSQDQMTEDLSLFLGNNTIRFTVWYVSEFLYFRSKFAEVTVGILFRKRFSPQCGEAVREQLKAWLLEPDYQG
jgi:hypothetical protein